MLTLILIYNFPTVFVPFILSIITRAEIFLVAYIISTTRIVSEEDIIFQ